MRILGFIAGLFLAAQSIFLYWHFTRILVHGEILVSEPNTLILFSEIIFTIYLILFGIYVAFRMVKR